LLGTVVFASGMSLMYPALLVLALDGVSEAERGSVVGTISTFFDASQGLGALICGAVVQFTGNAGAFTTGAICALIGLAVLRGRSATRAPAPA
jgi:predicted MFS family arabinose efflux permease